MSDRRVALGRRGEELAAEHLTSAGMRILERNWRCARGEIDLVAQEGRCRVLVEVRCRAAGSGLGTPEESVGVAKLRRMRLVAQHYLQATGWSGPVRVDVVTLVVGADGLAERISHYPNALAS